MKSFIIDFLEMTAWRMEAPHMFGAFHLVMAAAAAAAAFLLARRLAGPSMGASARAADQGAIGGDISGRSIRILSVTGWLLVLLELYKQLFLYYIVNDGAYDWWFFPFQLCSVPMYLCVLLPLTRGRLSDACLTFMATFTLLSGIAALAFPEDFMRSYLILTLHGFIWHGMLLFIAFYIAAARIADLSVRGFSRAALLFAAACVIAVCINIAAEPLANAAHAAGAVPNSYSAMFYLNPYHISPQPVVGTVQMRLGIPAGLLLYALAIIAASGLLCMLLGRCGRGRGNGA